MPVSAATHFHMSPTADNDQLIFGIDLDPQLQWDPSFADIEPDFKSNSYTFSALSNYEFGPPGNVFYDTYSPPIEDLSTWINDSEFIPSPSFSPTDDAFAVPHLLPRSLSPTSSFDDTTIMRPRVRSVISPCEVSLQAPSWATQLWESTSPTSPTSPTSSALRTLSRPSIRHSPLTTDATVRQQRIPIRRSSLSLSSMHLFHPSSAPTTHAESSSSPVMTRSYTTKNSDSVGVVAEDRDATVRSSRRKRTPESESSSAVTVNPAGYAGMNSKKDIPPLKSLLRPPKLAPSAWQLYFTDWIQKQQASGTRKLNVAQAAKEAGQEYALLSLAEKEPYKRRSQAMKEAREKEHEAYMRSLTPDDIKRENAFRAAQRKAGKSRRSNIKDPNAPKKPLSAYFMFLQQIRANPRLVAEIFGDETETTKQSVLAAAKWRSMTDAERQPFLAQAEQEKMEYEAARRLYEEGVMPGFGSSINFSILPGSPHFSVVKMESESESEGSVTDDGSERPVRS